MNYTPIPGFPGYSITSTGMVRSDKRMKILGQCVANNGYLVVNLRKCKHGVQRTVHSLVLLTFVGPRPIGFDSSHNNGNRLDNRIENLRWESRRDNIHRKKMQGTQCVGQTMYNAKLTNVEAKDVHALCKLGWSHKRIAIKFGMARNSISNVLAGRRYPNVHPTKRKEYV